VTRSLIARKSQLPLTHHQTTVERLGTDSDNDVFTDTLGNLGAGDEETILLEGFTGSQRPALLDTLFVRGLLDQVGFTGSSRLVTFDIVSSEEDTVDGKNFTSLDNTDITDEDVLYREEHIRVSDLPH
jgi:hypothetical protein